MIVVDKLIYAGNLLYLDAVADDSRSRFVHGDIVDRTLVDGLLAEHRPRAVLNFTAQMRVDGSIAGPVPFIYTNIIGTIHLLEAAFSYRRAAPDTTQRFCFLQVLMDEVCGSPRLARRRLPKSRLTRPTAPTRRRRQSLVTSRSRLCRDLSAVGAGYQLLEQLRSVPVSREADSSDDLQCARRPVTAGLWRRRQRT